MSASKKKGKKKVNDNPTKCSGSMTDDVISEATFKTLFSKAGTGSCNRISMNPGDMASLGIKSGKIVSLEFETKAKVFINVHSSSQTIRGNIALARFWQPNFGDSTGRNVHISTTVDAYNLVECLTATFEVSCPDSMIKQIQTLRFRAYVLAMLRGCLVCPGLRFHLTWKAVKITVQFCSGQSLTHSTDDEREKVFSISSRTDARFLMTGQFTSTTEANGDVDENLELHRLSHTGATRSEETPVLFAGYRAQQQLIGQLIDTALLSDQNLPTPPAGPPAIAASCISASTAMIRHVGFKRPKGLLISGPRGTGKTLLMNEIAASLARLKTCHIERLSPDILHSRYEGEAELAIQQIFASARRHAPSIILMDDVDILCANRADSSNGNGLSDLRKRIVSSLLTLIEGVSESSDTNSVSGGAGGVFILATSSSPRDIDPAMRRPGRLDREVDLEVPSSQDRQSILLSLLQAMQVPIIATHTCLSDNQRKAQEANDCVVTVPAGPSADGVTLSCVQDVAQRAHGMVGADLLLICKEACLLAVERCAIDKGKVIPASRDAGAGEGSRMNPVNLADDLDFSELSLEDQSSSVSSGINKRELASSSPAAAVLGDGRAIEIGNVARCLVTDHDLLLAATRVKPSAVREVSVEVPKVRWADIGGMDSVKQSLQEVVEWPLQYPDLFITMGVTPPKGVLLYGPPGCSKTLMAKALATESGLNFLTVRGPELLSKWLGDSEKAVQKLFQRARACAPSLIFFDEIDAFACKRGESSSGVNDRVLSQLLTEIDGIQGLKRVVIVAATNRPDILDAALLRPGRIDRKIFVPPPDRESRHQILSNSLMKIPCAGDVNIDELVDKSEGFSGAEVVAVCTEAVMHAVAAQMLQVERQHLLKSVEEITPQITMAMLDYYKGIAAKFLT